MTPPKIVTYNSVMDYAIRNANRERIVKNGVPTAKLDAYLKACELAIQVFPSDKGVVQIDNPEIPYAYHCICIDVLDVDFEDDRLKQFADLLGMFDGMTIFGKEVFNMVLRMDCTYEGK